MSEAGKAYVDDLAATVRKRLPRAAFSANTFRGEPDLRDRFTRLRAGESVPVLTDPTLDIRPATDERSLQSRVLLPRLCTPFSGDMAEYFDIVSKRTRDEAFRTMEKRTSPKEFQLTLGTFGLKAMRTGRLEAIEAEIVAPDELPQGVVSKLDVHSTDVLLHVGGEVYATANSRMPLGAVGVYLALCTDNIPNASAKKGGRSPMTTWRYARVGDNAEELLESRLWQSRATRAAINEGNVNNPLQRGGG